MHVVDDDYLDSSWPQIGPRRCRPATDDKRKPDCCDPCDPEPGAQIIPLPTERNA